MKYIKHFLLAIGLAVTFSCNKSIEKTPEAPTSSTSNTEWIRVKADTATDLNIPGFYPTLAYQLGDNYIVSGHSDMPKQNDIDGVGAQLLILDKDKNIIFRGQENPELFQYQPVFFRGKDGRVMILVQKAFDYFCGADAFIFNNQSVDYIGNLDVEPSNPEVRLVDRVQIQNNGKEVAFRIQSDSLVLNPGGEDKVIPNNNLQILTRNGKIQNPVVAK